VGYDKITIFNQYLTLLHVVNDVTIRCCKQSVAGLWQVGTCTTGVSVQHSSEVHHCGYLLELVYSTRVRCITVATCCCRMLRNRHIVTMEYQ